MLKILFLFIGFVFANFGYAQKNSAVLSSADNFKRTFKNNGFRTSDTRSEDPISDLYIKDIYYGPSNDKLMRVIWDIYFFYDSDFESYGHGSSYGPSYLRDCFGEIIFFNESDRINMLDIVKNTLNVDGFRDKKFLRHESTSEIYGIGYSDSQGTTVRFDVEPSTSDIKIEYWPNHGIYKMRYGIVHEDKRNVKSALYLPFVR